MCNFRAQLIVQIYYNLLLYWLKCGFTGKYTTRKIHAKLHAATEWRINCEQSLFKLKIGEDRTRTRNRRVDQTRALKPRAASSTGFRRLATLPLLASVRLGFSRRFRAKERLLAVKWDIFHIVCHLWWYWSHNLISRFLRWFLGIALRISAAHDFRVISACAYKTWEISLKLSSIAI